MKQSTGKTQLFDLDFSEIRRNAGGRVKPVFRVSELLKADPSASAELKQQQATIVKRYAVIENEQLTLPMINSKVLAFLKVIRFTSAPVVVFGRVEVLCGKEVVSE